MAQNDTVGRSVDIVVGSVLADEPHHQLRRRSSSAWAKYADALRKISLARFSSRFSRSRCLSRCRSEVLRLGRHPASRSACRTQLRSVSAEQPILSATDRIVATANRERVRAPTPAEPLVLLPLVSTSSVFPSDPIFSSYGASGNPGAIHATATPEQVRRFLLGVGDVVITKDSESWNDIAVPAVVAEDLTDVLCGYHLAQIKPRRGLDGRFLARQFSAIGTQDQFHIAANGITSFGLGGNAIRTGLFPIAPVPEQRAIADFLDRETAKIDELVADKERLIELLQEKRTALITRAVTRGLDPNVPMKDSGVEWLGEVPAHWEVARIAKRNDNLSNASLSHCEH